MSQHHRKGEVKHSRQRKVGRPSRRLKEAKPNLPQKWRRQDLPREVKKRLLRERRPLRVCLPLKA
jgi:hypothetical protein